MAGIDSGFVGQGREELLRDVIEQLSGGGRVVARVANPTWEQAFSADAGATWETNWTMEFRRRAA